MKFTTIAVAAASAGVVVAQPHAHNHRHFHEKRGAVTTVTQSAAAQTAYAYVLDGHQISVDEVCKGIENDSLKWADGTAPAGVTCSKSSSTTTWSSTTTPSTTPPTTTWTSTTTSTTAPASAGQFYQASGSYSARPSSTTGWSNSGQNSGQNSGPGQNSGSSSGWGPGSATGVTAAFPDGQLDCSSFPSQYGAVPLSYLGMGGWSGLQAVTISGNAVTNIVTGVSGQTCTEGMMCSYACPPGYQKAQWPSTQGATGQSVGGLQCSGGKLHLTNPSLSSSLCIPGVGGVQATNNAGGVVAICRTDYPGTESETIPVELQPGQTEALACPDAANYYTWQGASTSAQYYLNPIGIPASQGCQWGSPGSNYGNYAPINFGVGAKDGVTWLSIFQNAPTTNAQYQGTVEIQGSLSAVCKYQNGQYCGATGCNSQGCTVSN